MSVLLVVLAAALALPATQAAAATPTQQATVRQIIHTSAYSPASPDPAGITYAPGADRLLISDSEVEEMPLYQGMNLFTATRTGSGAGTGTTVPWGNEPTGLGFNPSNGTLYISDDDRDRVFIVRPGTDGVHGTADDLVTSISTLTFGSGDAEGVEYDTVNGHLYICDGSGLEVFDVDPVDGVFANGNDVVTHFDLAQYGAGDCEGIGHDPARGTLLTVDPSKKRILELTRSGDPVRIIDLSGIQVLNKFVAGVTMAPTSDPGDSPSAMNYWVVDRQVDNDAKPDENDGKLYELAAPPAPPPVDARPTVAVTAPPEGATVSGTVAIRASASDDAGVARVEFLVDGAPVGTDTDGSNGWSQPWNSSAASDGVHTITARAVDTIGQTTSDSNSVTVDNTPPAVSVTAPSAGSTVSGTTPVKASASDNSAVASVRFVVDGSSVGTDSDGADGWSVPWDTTLGTNGAHTVTAVATDGAGNSKTSDQVQVTVTNDGTVDVPVRAGLDDADETDSGAVRRTNGDLELGSEQLGIPTTVGMRFTGVPVPRGARIERAFVQFQVDEKTKIATSLSVRAERSDDAAAITSTAFNVTSRPQTAASVGWQPPRWEIVGAAGADQRTPDISALMQEVVDRPGWSSGNAFMVIIGGSGRRTAESFEGGAPPVLHVDYVLP